MKFIYDNTSSTTFEYEGNSLAHHGIKGQKWGLRRFQNKDGSLTLAGKKRYRIGIGDGDSDSPSSAKYRSELIGNHGYTPEYNRALYPSTDFNAQFPIGSKNRYQEEQENKANEMQKAADYFQDRIKKGHKEYLGYVDAVKAKGGSMNSKLKLDSLWTEYRKFMLAKQREAQGAADKYRTTVKTSEPWANPYAEKEYDDGLVTSIINYTKDDGYSSFDKYLMKKMPFGVTSLLAYK